MSEDVAQIEAGTPLAAEAGKASKTFLQHARLISVLTLVSRILGVLRESLAAKYFGAGLVSSAFAVAFAIPNLFRRLFGEGALSVAFIPLYSQALKEQDRTQANRFAAASINLLIVCVAALTLLGELILWAISQFAHLDPDRLLAIKLTAIMLPYALLICSTAFLGAVLQVNRRFGLVAASPIALNVLLIGSTVLTARIWNLSDPHQQVKAIYFISACVVIAGAIQVAMLLPALRRIGFRFELTSFWTPAVRRMLKLSIPVAIGAGVLQISVLLDRAIAYFLAAGEDVQSFTLFGHSYAYPMQLGAAARLFWAQLLYQFPLGVFAIALATAIFPKLSADALEADRKKFREGLRRGIKVALWEGIPASVGLMIVAQPAVQVLFERGRFMPADTALVAASLQVFSAAIWAFSLQQILSRAYYALHDTLTPLIMSTITLAIDLSIKLSAIWFMGERGMALGTSVSFTIQVVAMLLLLRRRVGSLGLREVGGFVGKVMAATAMMALACWAIQKAPFYPADGKATALLRLAILVMTGGLVYLASCMAAGIGGLEHILPSRKRA